MRWSPVVDFEGCYEVSDRGQVRSLPRPRAKNGILRPMPIGKQHVALMVDLCRPGAGRRRRSIAHLVLEAFVGARPDGLECRHLNDDAHDNCLENLTWGTKAENILDRDRNGKTARGARHGCAILTEVDVRNIKRSKDSRAVLARRFGVSAATIADARTRSWRHVVV